MKRWRLAGLVGPGALAALLALDACAPEFQPNDSLSDTGAARTRPKDGGSDASSPTSSSSSGAPSSSSGGATSDDGGGSSGTPPTACDSSRAVEPPVDLPGLVDANYRQHARLTADELQVAFLQRRTGTSGLYDAYLASRSSIDEPFGPPVAIATARAVWGLSFSNDGLTLYLSVDEDGRLRTITRPALDQPFGAQQRMSGLPDFVYSPFVAADGSLLYAFWPRSAPSRVDRAEMQDGNVISIGQLFSPSNTDVDVDYPTLSADGQELYYVQLEYDGEDTYPSYRRVLRTGESWVETPVPGLFPDTHEVTWISRDGCRLYLTNWRNHTLQIAQRVR